MPFGSAGRFPAGNAPNRDRESLIHIFPVNDAADQMLQPARQRRHIERIVQRRRRRTASDSPGTPPTPSPDAPDAATALEAVSPAGWAERTVERQVARHRLDLPGGDDMTSAVRAHHRRRQPHVDRKARQAARAPSRSRLPPLGMHRRKMSTDQPLVAHRLPSLTSRPAAARPLSAQPVGSPVYARRTVHPSARPRALGSPVLLAGACSGAGFIPARGGSFSAGFRVPLSRVHPPRAGRRLVRPFGPFASTVYPRACGVERYWLPGARRRLGSYPVRAGRTSTPTAATGRTTGDPRAAAPTARRAAGSRRPARGCSGCGQRSPRPRCARRTSRRSPRAGSPPRRLPGGRR